MRTEIRVLGWAATGFTMAGLALASAPVAGADRTAPIADGTSPVVSNCVSNQNEVQPSSLLLACGDGGLSVRDIAWSSWGPDTAEGDGTEYRRVCEPSCAAGHEASGPTHIVLRKLQGNYFTEAAISDLSGQPETWPVGPLRR